MEHQFASWIDSAMFIWFIYKVQVAYLFEIVQPAVPAVENDSFRGKAPLIGGLH